MQHINNEILAEKIGTKTVEESNAFLRKLWSELSKTKDNGWFYGPYTDTKKHLIHIGSNNWGRMYFSYKERGSIEMLYFELSNPCDKQIVKEAIKTALLSTCKIKYEICLNFSNKNGVCIFSQTRHGIMLSSSSTQFSLKYSIYAYSELDLRYYIQQKLYLISYFLFVYTKQLFYCDSCHYTQTVSAIEDSSPVEYDYEWFDPDECPATSNDELILPDEFFRVIKATLDYEVAPNNLSRIENAVQLIFNVEELKNIIHSSPQYNHPGFVDIINTIAVSSLEAISMLEDSDTETCSACGQTKYKISQRISDLMGKYLGEYWAKDMKNRLYPNRSKFLHEGRALTTSFPTQTCYPLINPYEPNKMLYHNSYIDYTLVDFCCYIIRWVIYENIDKLHI